MNKLIFSLILFGFCITTSAQIQTSKSDTVFISKNPEFGSKQSIFIDPNKNSEGYKKITDFQIDEFSKENHDAILKDLLQKNKNTKALNIEEITKNWIEIHLYNNQYYVYKSCDFYNQQMAIKDNILTHWSMEGQEPHLILSAKQSKSNIFDLKLKGNYLSAIKIYWLDEEKGLAVFEELVNGKHSEYYIMLDSRKVSNFPIIINNCTQAKQSEMRFDKINFQKLLKK